jgi:hypothetical protein
MDTEKQVVWHQSHPFVDLTLSEVNNWLIAHQYPEYVIVSPATFIQLCHLCQSVHGVMPADDSMIMLGTHWIRGTGTTQCLNVQQSDVPVP